MSASPALACKAALSEMNRLHPNRSRASDGIMPSAAHTVANPTSDHELGNAFDVTHDPSQGVDTYLLADELRKRCKAGLERRVKYIISHGRIASSIDGWAWRRYEGDNQHDHHMHVSIFATARNDTHSWWPQVVAHAQVPPTPIGDGDMTPEQDDRLKKIERLLVALVAPRLADHKDRDPGAVDLGDLLTSLEKQ